MRLLRKTAAFFTVIAILIVCLPSAMADAGLSLYVSPSGSDSASGTVDDPFATLEAARDKIREIKKSSGLPAGGVNVYLREGVYKRTAEFLLTEEDSGSERAPITYMAYPGEMVSILGGTDTSSDQWSLVTDENLYRIPEAARGKVYQLDLGAMGYTKEQIGEMDYRGSYSSSVYQPNSPTRPTAVELFCDDYPQTVARYPNEGYIYIKKVIKNSVSWFYEQTDPSGFIIEYEDTHLDKWAGIKNAKLYGFFMYNWADATVDIKEVNTRKHTIESGQATAFGVHPNDGIGGRYYGYNMLEELDIPGEYYLDTDSLIMYYYPEKDIKKHKIELSLFNVNLIHAKKASYITIKDMNISTSRGDLVLFENCDHCIVDSCTVANSGGSAITVYEGTDNGVQNSEIMNTNGGITLRSFDGLPALKNSNNFAKNNKIHNFARLRLMYNPGVMAFGVGNYIGYNEIYDGPHFAIMMHQVNETTIEYNNLHHVLLDTSDAGAIYWGLHHQQEGQIIRYNHIHHCGYGQVLLVGIYPDGGAGGFEAYGNVITGMPQGTGITSFGSNVKNYNNVFIEVTQQAIHQWGQYDMAYSYEGIGQRSGEQYVKLGVDIHSAAWTNKYPYLVGQFARTGEDWYTPVNNITKNNIAIDGPGDVTNSDFVNNAVEYIPTVTATKSQVKWSYDENDNLTLDQEAIKKLIPEWEEIDLKAIGTYSVPGNPNFSGTHASDDDNNPPDEDDETTVKLKDAVAFAISASNSMVSGEKKAIDEENSNVTPVIKEGRTLLPVRFLAEAFGAEVEWDDAARTVSLTKDGKLIKMKIGENKITVDGVDYETDIPAQIIENRTMLPLRILCETAFGKKVFWDKKGFIAVSDTENLFDSEKDSAAISRMINELKK